ncbi:MAG TPA: A24 family peptidase [Pirellulales bacterium]|jgi:prepilin peptidase CpaA|nr:A24 family peptidase [Pirellulales bacterium]
MVALGLLLVLVSIAGYTDVRRRLIYNWTTYPGIIAAFVLNAVPEVVTADAHFLRSTLGCIGLEDCAQGFALCGGLMVAGFILFGIGGGDVKLLAMVGAFLGVEQGLEVLLWTFVLGGIWGAVLLIWRVGAWRLVQRVFQWSWSYVRWTTIPELTAEERRLFRSDLFLAPFMGIAILLVKSGWLPNL